MQLEQLDLMIAEHATKLDSVDGSSKVDLLAELEQKVKRERRRLVGELEAAWAELGQKMSEAESQPEDSGSCNDTSQTRSPSLTQV